MIGCHQKLTIRLAMAACLFSVAPAAAQTSDQIQSLVAQIRELRVALDAMQEQVAGSRRESEELRRELQAVRDQLDSLKRATGAQVTPPSGAPGAGDRIDAVAVEQDLLKAKVEDQEQTKVESGSKYHVRLSGLALLNIVGTRRSVDSLDLPGIAQATEPGESGGSFSAGVRQSLIGLEVFGPTFGGAKTSGDVTFDFFGGFPSTNDGVNSPLVRLRTTKLTLEWKNTSVVAGQDGLFFSPRSPTSLASTAYPALSSSGNLWTWTPQVHVEHRIPLTDDSTLTLAGGILDAFTGELPAREYSRMATAGERSRAPAQAVRIGWQRAGDQPVAVGAGAYHASQNWGFDRTVDAWAAMTDWDVPLGPWFALSGELYRGQAIGGLGGGASGSVLFDGAPTAPASAVLALRSTGGWSQLKFKPVSRLEFNAAYGKDHSTRDDIARLLAIGSLDPSAVNRNGSGFLNAIYQARSNLLFSVEYRRLWTTGFDDVQHTADHISLSTGIVF